MSLEFDGELNLNSQFDGEMGIEIQTPGAGSDKYYAYEQSQLSDTWIIHHNLHKFPSVTVVDTAKSDVVGEVEYVDWDTVIIRFNVKLAGYAYFN